MHWEAFLVLAVCSFAVAFERMWRFRGDPATLTHKTFLVALFTLGVAAVAYGTMPLTADFYNIGLGTWHTLVGILVGTLEMLALLLRNEKVSPAAVRAIQIRSGLVTIVLFVTYLFGFADAPPLMDLSESAPRNGFLLVHLVVFPAYVVWGLMNIIDLCRRRFFKDLRRRPVSAVAFLMVAAGCAGFVAINILINVAMIFQVEVDLDIVFAPTPIYVALWIFGCGLLAIGDRAYEETVSLFALARLKPLWFRVIEFLPEESHLPVRHLPASARLQRAYVEISDAICTLRVDAGCRVDVDEAAVYLRGGNVTTDPSAPTLSEALPPRKGRKEDIQLVHSLARAYRKSKHLDSGRFNETQEA